jgi:hypothetical protein
MRTATYAQGISTMNLRIYHVGDRVELAPHLDLWMRGARFGTVSKITRNGVRVDLDRLKRKGGILFRHPAESLTVIGKAPR